MKKYLLVFFLILCLQYSTLGQNNHQLTAGFESLLSSQQSMPFWFTANQNGRYPISGNTIQVISLSGKTHFDSLLHTNLRLDLGAHLLSSYTNEFQFQANELYSKLYWKGWKLEGGWFKEPEYFMRLSSTNGNIDRSNNARPYPRIRFGTNEFIPFLFWKNYFSFKAEYDEGWLNDERWVMGTRLHHKSLYLKTKITKNSSLSAGLNHYVMWGGTSSSPQYGQLPQSLSDYFIYITGSIGGPNFPITDQFNVAGNQFGSYRVQYDLTIKDIQFSAYFNHLFEDHSGMEFRNGPDNLYGLFAQIGKHKVLESAIYEFMYTLHQGGSAHVQGSTGLDNYYNHGVYHSGYSYDGRMMVSPLFGPVIYKDGIAFGIANNRIIMHHLGLAGELSSTISWNGKFTYSKNYGTYSSPYDPVKNQLASLLNLAYHSSTFPLDISLSVAADFGQLYDHRVGAMLKISKTF
ncbi:MAG: capsule assembly Wzi family protein [Prolixibacteraceae bacterium]